MKKWLIGCLTVLAMVCLIPGIVLKAAAETVTLKCPSCRYDGEYEVIKYKQFDSKFHSIIVKNGCPNCEIHYKFGEEHSGGTETPTCTTGKTCEKCGAEYGILGHDGGAWTSDGDGTNTHTRRCKRSNCDKEETESCSGGGATCTSPGVCATCGGSYYGGHDLVHHEAKAPTCTGIGWDAYEACKNCNYTTRTELPALNHALEQHAAKAPTCTEKGWDAYETCSRCNHTTRTELPALNHALEQHAAKAPTCTEKGWNAYETCSRCDHTTYAELPALNHDYQAVTVDPTCEADGYTVFTCSRCKDSYTADPTDKLGHQFGAWSPNGTGSQSAGCLRQGCAHTGSTDCRKFTFRTAEGETLTFCPVCGQAENAAQLEKIEAATAWAHSGSLSAEDVTARTNGEYLSVAFETAGSLTQPTGRVRLALPAGLLEGKKLVRIAPDGTQTELPFEAKNGKLIFTLDFANSELPVMLFRLVPQTTVL